MGLADMMGWNNPFTNFVGDNSNALMRFGTGFAQGKGLGDGLAQGAQGLAQGAPLDDAYAITKKAEAEKQENLNQTIQYMQSKGWNDLVTLADAGQMDVAWAEAIKRSAPGYGQPELTSDMRNFQFAQENPDFAGFMGIGAAKPTDDMREYEYARTQGYGGTFQDFQTEMKRAGATTIDFNQNQGVAAAFADRMANANEILSDPALTEAQINPVEAGKSGVPYVGNFLTSQERKMAEQAQRDFINAILRRESGAVISPSEFDNAAKQYFPQPGDTPAVIDQKRRNREIALDGVRRAAGPNYAPPSLIPPGVIIEQIQ